MTTSHPHLISNFKRARLVTASVLVVCALAAVLPVFLFGIHTSNGLTLNLVERQDFPILTVLLLLLMIPVPFSIHRDPTWLRRSTFVLGLSMFSLLLIGWAGHYLVFQGYSLSRDEQLAVFDQEIYSRAKLFWPIAPEWRSLADSLNRRFMLTTPGNEFWISGYLPIHSAFRALISLAMDPALSSPIMGAIAAFSLWIVTRQLWPNSRITSTVALILLVTSSQILITAMTAYSMTMHLALNMVWLALFLKDRWPTHFLAIGVGFLATGIHQPLFHPLFVLPFFLLLLDQRRWKTLGLYLAAYGLIALFWLWWPIFISSHATSVAPAAVSCAVHSCATGAGFIDRTWAAIFAFSGIQRVSITGANLLRFALWQNPLLVPLAIFGAVTCWKSDRMVQTLALGLILPILLIAVILPWQGHGWGYRYIHPVLGNAILLACYGVQRLERAGLSIHRPLAVASVAAVCLLLVHAWMAFRLTTPFADARSELISVPADIVIVDTSSVPFAEDFVYNRFDLSNRPILLLAQPLKLEDLPKLCAGSSIAFFDAPRFHEISKLFVWKDPKQPTEKAQALRREAEALNCRIVGDQTPLTN